MEERLPLRLWGEKRLREVIAGRHFFVLGAGGEGGRRGGGLPAWLGWTGWKT